MFCWTSDRVEASVLRAIGALILAVTSSRPVRVCKQPACRSSRQLQLNPGAAVPVHKLHSRQSPWRETAIDPHRLRRHYRLPPPFEPLPRPTPCVGSRWGGGRGGIPPFLFCIFYPLPDFRRSAP